MPTTSLDAAVAEDAVPPPVPVPETSPGTVVGLTDFDLGKTRQNLAYRLLWIMIGVIAVFVIISLSYSVDCWNSDPAKGCATQTAALNIVTTTLSPIFTAMVGLVGSVIGFYFGSSKSATS